VVRESRSAWRLAKAERFLVAAEHAIEAGDWEAAVSRAYYAVYHAVIALIEMRAGVSRRRWDHDVVRNDFREHFASRGFLFSVRDAAFMASLFEARLIADYESRTTTEREAQRLVGQAAELFRRVVARTRDA